MALDTYKSIAGKVLLRCPMAGPLLARDWVANAFRRVSERRPWSWLVKQGQFIIYDEYATGTVTVTQGSTTVTGAGTAWTTADHAERQFRLSANTTPIYTVASVTNGTSLELDIAWGGETTAGASYEIYDAYKVVPSDFNYFKTVWDPQYNWQLHTVVSQMELNAWDAQRTNSGEPYLVSARDYFTPTGETIPLPRYEIWPHVKSARVIPFLYVARATDLQDSGATLARYIRGDVLMEMALAEAASWPGPDMLEQTSNYRTTFKPSNPYFNPQLAKRHEDKAEYMIVELERQDEEINMTSVWYDSITRLPWAPLPMDANFWQKHAL